MLQKIIGTAWVQVVNATLNFGIICQKKGVAYDPLLSAFCLSLSLGRLSMIRLNTSTP